MNQDVTDEGQLLENRSPESAPVSGGAIDAPAEACPPPLAWQEVLKEFHSQATPWYLDRPGYRLSGRMLGNGPPLYLLNGFGGTHELYALLVWLLRDEFRCVVWDFPGTTPGSKSARGVTLVDLANDVAEVARICGDSSINLFAPSFGALIALQTAITSPRLVRRMALQGGFFCRSLSRFERWLTRSCRFYPGPLRRFPGSRAVRQHNHRRWFPPFDLTRWQFLEDVAGRVPVSALACQAAIVRDTDLHSELPKIRQPVLLIETEGEGVATRDCQRELSAALSDSRLETILNTGQYPYLTHPHRMAKILREFFSP